ncbi:MAG: vitamin K epoxide reductase family protein [Propionibacteriaceae bacterium]|jgi:uncharacterized membrane protein|nr:vitamin K epoxide reductase family protein [Propionibacteriaceae bacterium]
MGDEPPPTSPSNGYNAQDYADVDAGLIPKSFFLSDLWLFGSMALCSALALLVSFILSVDSWLIASEPDLVLNCDINSYMSCGAVAKTWQATLVGFPNAFWGILFETVVLCVAIAKLMGSQFSRLFMFFLQGFYTLAIVFALWLFYQSAFVIHIFCPLCLVITVTTILEWFDLFRVNIRDQGLYMPAGLRKKLETAVSYNLDMLMAFLMLVGLAMVIIIKYGKYFFN